MLRRREGVFMLMPFGIRLNTMFIVLQILRRGEFGSGVN